MAAEAGGEPAALGHIARLLPALELYYDPESLTGARGLGRVACPSAAPAWMRRLAIIGTAARVPFKAQANLLRRICAAEPYLIALLERYVEVSPAQPGDDALRDFLRRCCNLPAPRRPGQQAGGPVSPPKPPLYYAVVGLADRHPMLHEPHRHLEALAECLGLLTEADRHDYRLPPHVRGDPDRCRRLAAALTRRQSDAVDVWELLRRLPLLCVTMGPGTPDVHKARWALATVNAGWIQLAAPGPAPAGPSQGQGEGLQPAPGPSHGVGLQPAPGPSQGTGLHHSATGLQPAPGPSQGPGMGLHHPAPDPGPQPLELTTQERRARVVAQHQARILGERWVREYRCLGNPAPAHGWNDGDQRRRRQGVASSDDQ